MNVSGDHQALLGDPDSPNGKIKVGYGFLAQTFFVDARYLNISYRVLSTDIAKGTDKYYDTFEVSLNTHPANITNAQRDSVGCADSALNPQGSFDAKFDGLLFCGGNPGKTGDSFDLGWQTVKLDMGAYQGKMVTIYMALWSREYDYPYFYDQGFYNTWAYIDNIILTDK